LAAFIWLGGMFLIAFVAVSILRNIEPPAERGKILSVTARRFRVLSWIAISVLLVELLKAFAILLENKMYLSRKTKTAIIRANWKPSHKLVRPQFELVFPFTEKIEKVFMKPH
jgi:uncharacterized membrane protein